jgi:hypothetical protein
VTAPDLEHGWQLTGSSADAYEQLLAPSGGSTSRNAPPSSPTLEDVLEPYVDDDGLALPIESHVALAAAS